MPKGVYQRSEAQLEAIRQRNKNMSSESRAKIADAKRGKPHPNYKPPFAGRKHTADTKAVMSVSAARAWNDEQIRAARIASLKAAPHVGHPIEASQIEALHKGRTRSVGELALFELVSTAYPDEVVVEQHAVGRLVVDVAIPRLQLAFEADGKEHRKTQDILRDGKLNALGWQVRHYTYEELEL